MFGYPKAFLVAALMALLPEMSHAQSLPPTCRLDGSSANTLESTLRLASKAYGQLGKALPFDRIVVNPKETISDGKTLNAYVVIDASASKVDKQGCITAPTALVPAEELDAISVRGGCVASGERLEIQCSSSAMQVFGQVGREDRANPALLYVLAHELGHVLQGRAGEYSGRVERIDLKATSDSKLLELRKSCDPSDTSAEEDADKAAVQILLALLPNAPYREPLFSEHGSILWGMDQLNLAANTWRKAALEREFISQPKPHPSYLATEFPTSSSKVQRKAKRFVCDVLTKKSGVVLYPGKAITHPPLEERMGRVAEALRPLAAALPKAGAKQEYKAIAVVQEQLSDIFTHIYRENGAYLEAVQSAVCTIVNGDQPLSSCAQKR